MPVCPRCKHPAERADTICTQCGSTVPAETEGRAPFSLAKILVVVILVALLAILLMFVLEYTQGAGRLPR